MQKKYSHVILSVLENHRTLISLYREVFDRSANPDALAVSDF